MPSIYSKQRAKDRSEYGKFTKTTAYIVVDWDYFKKMSAVQIANELGCDPDKIERFLAWLKRRGYYETVLNDLKKHRFGCDIARSKLEFLKG